MSTGKKLTEAALTALLPNTLLPRGAVSDIDTAGAGVYVYGANAANIPSGVNSYGILIVFQAEPHRFYVIVDQFGHIMTRMKWNGTMRDWKLVTLQF